MFLWYVHLGYEHIPLITHPGDQVPPFSVAKRTVGFGATGGAANAPQAPHNLRRWTHERFLERGER